MKYPLYMFSDESGDLSQKDERYMIASVVLTPDVKILSNLVKRTHHDYPKSKAKGHLHAAKDPREVTEFLLRVLSEQKDVAIGVMIFDKKTWWNQNTHVNDLYKILISHAIGLFLPTPNRDTFSNLNIRVVVEKRFKNKHHNNTLRASIAEHTGIAAANIDSVEGKNGSEMARALQVADALAWSWFQKFEREDDTYVSIIENHMQIREEVVGVDGAGVIRTVKEIRGY